MAIHSETIRSIRNKGVSAAQLSKLIGCIVDHASDILDGKVQPDNREIAIIRLCANVQKSRLESVLSELDGAHEWKPVPGFSRYEASSKGLVRRAAVGHGSMPGKVLQPWPHKSGHMRINLPPDEGKLRCIFVHQAVCLAFHGLPPTPLHVVCHKDDVKDHNHPDNLYWGTHQDNADDRVRNSVSRKIDTLLAQANENGSGEGSRRLKKLYKEQMLKRVKRLSKLRA